MEKTLGGERLHSGNKMKVDVSGYERSTHNIGYAFRTTMSPGTLVPFLTEIGTPGTTFEMELQADIQTLPTVGSLFGRFKFQLDVFGAPIRLYHAMLQMNETELGLHMDRVKLPLMRLFVEGANAVNPDDIDNSQVNPSSLIAYLNVRGIGYVFTADAGQQFRDFFGGYLLMYWDTYKQYYANKQEKRGFVVHNTSRTILQHLSTMQVTTLQGGAQSVTQAPALVNVPIINMGFMEIAYAAPGIKLEQIFLNTSIGRLRLNEILSGVTDDGLGNITGNIMVNLTGSFDIINWDYMSPYDLIAGEPELVEFPLTDIDEMRRAIMAQGPGAAFQITGQNMAPYNHLLEYAPGELVPYLSAQEGLGIKCYNSDLLNNWLNTEDIDGVGGINELTKIDTTSGGFTLDQLLVNRKVFDMLNKISVSGGTVDDWMDTMYTPNRYRGITSPVYYGGLIKEIAFQEVISNAEAGSESQASQPLGTIGGRGVFTNKHKGGTVRIKLDEHSMIMGIASITPILDYSQGTKWEMFLETLDDIHKPALDRIGWQELITNQMHWIEDFKTPGLQEWNTRSAGKQPAWVNYMTNLNRIRGNFAIENKQMFMVLVRRYEAALDIGSGTWKIKDLTTYIDPSKFNHIFGQTSIDAMNFRVNIGVKLERRAMMSAKIMPNL